MADGADWRWPNFGLYRRLFRLAGTLKAPPVIPDKLRLDGMAADAEIDWDQRAVPTIKAGTLNDGVRIQGYLHARMRGFQMDFLRRMPLGELAEILGPGALPNDTFMRQLNLRRWAEASVAETSPEALDILQAYVDGVNQGFQSGPPAPEYRFLKVSPRPWTLEDTAVLTYTLSWQLNGIWQYKWAFDRLAAQPEAAAWLFDAIAGTPEITIVPGTGGAYQGWGAGGNGVGSNNWVVSRSRSKSGKPLLANDPHLMPMLPSIWFQVAMDAGPLTIQGVSLPGTPGVIIGQNRHIAWGVTNVNPDCMELYRIRMDDGSHYHLDGEPADLTVREEIIRVRGGADIRQTCEESHAGPVIHRERDGSRIALLWTGLAPLRTLEAVTGLNQAQNWQQFNDALQSWAVPAQNFVYADEEGNIGYVLAGEIPLHPEKSAFGCLDGNTRSTLWTEGIPWDQMPRILNPDSGYIVTANNAPVGQDFSPQFVSHDSLGYRAHRIRELLEDTPLHDVQSFSRIQLDDFSRPVQELSNLLARDPDCPASWQPYLEQVDGRAAVNRVAPTLCYLWAMEAVPEAVRLALDAPLFHDVLPGAPGTHPFAENFWGLMGERLLPAVIARFHELDRKNAFTQANARGRKAFGDAVDSWTWGRAHQTVLFHPFTQVSLTKPVFGRKPLPTPGDYFTPRQAALPVDPNLDWPRPVLFMPSFREVLTPGDMEESRFVHLTGQSGHPLDPHYDDLIAPHFDGKLHPIGEATAHTHIPSSSRAIR